MLQSPLSLSEVAAGEGVWHVIDILAVAALVQKWGHLPPRSVLSSLRCEAGLLLHDGQRSNPEN